MSWAIKSHQALRFFPDEFGRLRLSRHVHQVDFGARLSRPGKPYIHEEYKRARNHKHYMTSRLICVNDIYAFDPNAKSQP